MKNDEAERGWVRAGYINPPNVFQHKELDNFIYQGKILTHYTNLFGLKGIIESNGLWLSDHRFLNDSEEYNNGQKLANSILKKLLKDIEYQKFKKVLELVLALLMSDEPAYYICSFSSKEDCLNQWKGYAKLDDSVAILFKNDTEKVDGYFSQSPLLKPSKVIYCDKKKEHILLNLIEHFFKEFQADLKNKEEIIYEAWAGFLFRQLVDEFINFKNEEFASEKEIRISVDSLRNGSDNKPKHRVSNNRIIPYITMSYGGENKLPIEKVIIGPTASLDITYKSVKVYLKNMGYNDVVVEKSKIPYRG